MLEGRNIVCFGFADWDNPYRTNQHHLMERLSKKNRVLFIESLGLRRPTLQKKDAGRMLRRLKKSLGGIRKAGETLFIYSPLVIPFHKYAPVRGVNRAILRRQLDAVVERLNFERPILWSYVPNAVEFLGRWNERASVYHCVDELSANPLIPGGYIKELETGFLRKVAVVFTTAKSLYESKRAFNPHTYYLPNVADFDHFNRATLSETAVPGDMAAIPAPRLGFIGAVSRYKIDFELLSGVARKHPEWSIVLIGAKGEGEKAADLRELEREKNIHILGGRPYGTLPGYLKGFDVCLLPNIINDYTKNMFPMKFFEYLSSGNPVVATMLDSLREFGEYCRLSGNREEFEANIIGALGGTDSGLREKRLSLARKYTWDERIREMSVIIQKHMIG